MRCIVTKVAVAIGSFSAPLLVSIVPPAGSSDS